jgi:hypothetical protein
MLWGELASLVRPLFARERRCCPFVPWRCNYYRSAAGVFYQPPRFSNDPRGNVRKSLPVSLLFPGDLHA